MEKQKKKAEKKQRKLENVGKPADGSSGGENETQPSE